MEDKFSWCDSNSFIPDPKSGTLIPAGTCLKVNDYIIFLQALTIEELKSLKQSVVDSVNCEISKRSNT